MPPERESYLADLAVLAVADRPDVVCMQELPVWALARLAEWTEMNVCGEVARPARLGPFPSTTELGRRITSLNTGLFRSGFSGQANAILVAREHRLLDRHALELNSREFRRAQTRWLGLDLVTRLAWAQERRVCQAIRLELEDGRAALVANLHGTGLPDDRLPDAELLRATSFADGLTRPGEICILAGDFNVRPQRSRTLADLVGPQWGFSRVAPGLDQVLVRGAETRAPVRWPRDRRTVRGRVLSDHAPVEVEVA